MRYGKGTYKLWFDYLVLAIRSGIPIDEAYYAKWGKKEELLSSTFNRWWKMKGIALCATNPQGERDAVKLQDQADGYVILRISTDVPMTLISRRVGEIVRGARIARRTRTFAKVVPSGQVNYKTLAVYQRLLAISLTARNSNLSMHEKIDLLKERYARIHARMKKQREALRKKGERGRRLARRWRSHDADTFDTTDDSGKSFSIKKAYRWLASAEHVMLNVAEGKFPGEGYYGDKIAERLHARKRAMGFVS